MNIDPQLLVHDDILYRPRLLLGLTECLYLLFSSEVRDFDKDSAADFVALNFCFATLDSP